MSDGSVFHSLYYCIGNTQNRIVCKSRQQLAASIYTCEVLVLRPSAQFESLIYHRGEILFTVDFRYMHKSRIRYHSSRKYPVSIGRSGRHEAVGGEQECTRYICKFFLLVLPCCAEVAL